jgi:hypothetical protein
MHDMYQYTVIKVIGRAHVDGESLPVCMICMYNGLLFVMNVTGRAHVDSESLL